MMKLFKTCVVTTLLVLAVTGRADDSNVLMPLIGDSPTDEKPRPKTKTKKNKIAAKVRKPAPVDSDPQTQELESRIKESQAEAERALQKAKEQQAKLEELKQNKLKAEKMQRQQEAKIQAERQTKIKEYRLSRAKVEAAQKNFKELIQETKSARAELEQAIKEANARGEIYKQAAIKVNGTEPTLPAMEPERLPTSVVSDPEPRSTTSKPSATLKAKVAPPTPPPLAPAKPDSSELKWSDEK